MLGRAATKIELNRDNDLEELVEARKLFEKKKLQLKPASHQLLLQCLISSEQVRQNSYGSPCIKRTQ